MMSLAHLQLVAAALTVASIGGTLTLLVLLRHMLHGRLRSALRTALIAATLMIAATASAVSLGLSVEHPAFGL